MAVTARNGREYLLLGLLPKIQDDNLWKIITRDLFELKDRHHSWKLEIYDRFEELQQDELDTNCQAWTKAGTKWLQQIALDIRCATSLFSPDKWDSHILQDFLNLMAFTLQLFQGTQKCLGMVKQHCQNLKTSDQATFDEQQDASGEFDNWRTRVNNELRILVKSLRYQPRNWDDHNRRLNLQEGDKVPGATFTELLIQNEIQRHRSKIVSRPVEIKQQDTKHVSGVNAKEATEVICMLTHLTNSMFLSDIGAADILANFKKVYQEERKVLDVDDSPYWRPRTIAVVADAGTGVIVTGATKPTAPSIPIFKDVADNISRIRVGEDFGSIIADCSRDVWEHFRRIKGELRDVKLIDLNSDHVTKELAGLYDAVVCADKNSVASYQNIPFSKNGIMSWAFGSDFEFKPPCTRCQRLYSEWYLHEMPDTPGKKLRILVQDHNSGSIKHSSQNRYPCNYCAETVAAAKLHVFYNGTLTLVLSKDTNRIRASDKLRTSG